jgi:hypothetical protein
MEIEMIAPVAPMTDEEMINELAREIAEATLAEDVDAEYESMLDELFAEHQAMLYAAQSWDLDAIAYGEM